MYVFIVLCECCLPVFKNGLDKPWLPADLLCQPMPWLKEQRSLYTNACIVLQIFPIPTGTAPSLINPLAIE